MSLNTGMGFGRPTRRLLLAVIAAFGVTAFSASAALGAPTDAKAEGTQATQGGFSPQIVGGTLDRRRDVNWIGAVLSRGPGSRFQRQFCGGSLVASRWFLTAAHCMEQTRARRIEILFGTKNLNRGGKVVGVARIHRYPSYNPNTVFGDMALLKLKRPVGYKPAVPVRQGVHFVGTSGYVAGWGSIRAADRDNAIYDTRLRSTFIPIRPDSHCEGALFPPFNGSVMLCAGFLANRGTCFGDSGGPLARKIGGRWRLVGVTSYGRRVCGSLTSYAWVGSSLLRPWIRRHVGR